MRGKNFCRKRLTFQKLFFFVLGFPTLAPKNLQAHLCFLFCFKTLLPEFDEIGVFKTLRRRLASLLAADPVQAKRAAQAQRFLAVEKMMMTGPRGPDLGDWGANRAKWGAANHR